MNAIALDFDSSDVFEQLEAIVDDPSRLDELAFGVVAMDLEGTVLAYNLVESRLSGLAADRVLGVHFFSAVAPCTNNYLVAARFEENDLDDTIPYVFTLRMRPTPVRLRLLKRADADHQYLLVARS